MAKQMKIQWHKYGATSPAQLVRLEWGERVWEGDTRPSVSFNPQDIPTEDSQSRFLNPIHEGAVYERIPGGWRSWGSQDMHTPLRGEIWVQAGHEQEVFNLLVWECFRRLALENGLIRALRGNTVDSFWQPIVVAWREFAAMINSRRKDWNYDLMNAPVEVQSYLRLDASTWPDTALEPLQAAAIREFEAFPTWEQVSEFIEKNGAEITYPKLY